MYKANFTNITNKLYGKVISVGICDSDIKNVSATVPFCIFCDFVYFMFQTVALILLPINSDLSMVAQLATSGRERSEGNRHMS